MAPFERVGRYVEWPPKGGKPVAGKVKTVGKRTEKPGKSVIFDLSSYMRLKHLRACVNPEVNRILSQLQPVELPVLVETDDYFLLPLKPNQWMAKKAAFIKEVLEA